MDKTLVIVPCGQGKIWDKDKTAGSVPAKNAYIGAPFKVNREYAECFAEKWVILSAKYGFIETDFEIPGPYNITFKKRSPELVSIETLKDQARKLGLEGFETIIGLGGKDDRNIIQAVFSDTNLRLLFPFAGLPIGKAMAATKQAIRNG